jgi:hypothetical protein
VVLDKLILFPQISLAEQAVYDISCTLIKLSTIILLRRITDGVQKFYVYFLWATTIVVIAYPIVFEITLFVGCQPLNAYWNSVNPAWEFENKGQYKCFNEAANIMAATIGAMLTDFTTFLLPLLLFRKLQIPFRQKLALGCLFGVGFL